MYRYVQQIPDGGDLLDVSSLLPDVAPLVAIKIDDHHAKLHIHTLSEHDPQIAALADSLTQRHKDLRFTLYHEHAGGYATVHARGGQVQWQSNREKQ